MRARDLPSLTALSAFEAAARHGSFKAAAAEMNVTPPAISRQVRELESELDSALFLRRHRQVELTTEGHQLYESVRHAFDAMSNTARTIRSPNALQVRVGSTNAVASFWLIPRLGDFWRRYPDVDFHHVISDQSINLEATKTDLAIRFGRGEWKGLDSRTLYTDRIYPVCSPAFAETLMASPDAEQLASCSLLDLSDVREEGWLTWHDWFSGIGADVKPRRQRFFNSYVVAVQAAMDGLGIALGWHSLVSGAVASGKLVAVSDYIVEAPGAFHLITPKGAALSNGALHFIDWIDEQVANLAGSRAYSG